MTELVDVCGRIALPSLGWSVDIEVTGLTPTMASWIEERWEGLSRGGESAGAADAELRLAVTDAPVGIPLTPLVEVRLAWRDATHATLSASSADVDLEIEPHSLRGRGRLHAPHARGGLEAVFRAVATLSLARRHVAVLHASAVTSPDGALLFLGASEAGKTTTARRLGREGFTRIADDMIAIDLSRDPPTLHPLPFERAGRWPAGAKAVADDAVCVAAGRVHKVSPLAVEVATDAVRAWAEARLGLPCGPGRENATLDDFAALCRVPMFDVSVPPAGPLGAMTRAMMAGARRKRVDEAPPLDHASAERFSPTFMSPPENIALTETSVVTRAPSVAWRVLDGQAVLVAPSSPLIHSLNEVGTLVWTLADGRPLSAILDEVVNEFAVTRTQALVDVEAFVGELLNKHLFTVTVTP